MEEIKKGIEHLKKKDAIIGKLIEHHPVYNISPSQNYLKDLVSTVLSQQLSWKVYIVIEKRLFEKLKNKFEPDKIIALPDEEYRSCGISGSKTRYIKNVAAFYKENSKLFKNIHKLNNDQIVEELTKIKGIGHWSVHMFLIFNLGRLDVFPLKDGGIRSSMKKLYGFKQEPTDKQLLKIADKWGNYKTIASWYIWRHLEK